MSNSNSDAGLSSGKKMEVNTMDNRLQKKKWILTIEQTFLTPCGIPCLYMLDNYLDTYPHKHSYNHKKQLQISKQSMDVLEH